jgi:hypothetical protein
MSQEKPQKRSFSCDMNTGRAQNDERARDAAERQGAYK